MSVARKDGDSKIGSSTVSEIRRMSVMKSVPRTIPRTYQQAPAELHSLGAVHRVPHDLVPAIAAFEQAFKDVMSNRLKIQTEDEDIIEGEIVNGGGTEVSGAKDWTTKVSGVL
jgi:hypothetical protein